MELNKKQSKLFKKVLREGIEVKFNDNFSERNVHNILLHLGELSIFPCCTNEEAVLIINYSYG